MLYFFQQDDLAQAGQQMEPVVEEKTLSLFDLMMSGGVGGQIIIGILFIAGLLSSTDERGSDNSNTQLITQP